MEAASDQVNLFVDLARLGDDILDPRMRTADDQDDAVRGIDGQRQFLGAGGVGNEGDEPDAGGNLGGLVDRREIGVSPGGPEFHDFRWLAVVIAHFRR